jgi:hypothetical protein
MVIPDCLIHDLVVLSQKLHAKMFLHAHPFRKILDVGEHDGGKFPGFWQCFDRIIRR